MIGEFSLSAVEHVLAAHRKGSDSAFSRVSIDSRDIQPRDLFVAIKGPNFDGHRFVNEVATKGAVAAVVSEPIECEIPVLLVNDTREALGRLGKFNRDRFEGPILAVTGSAGKTTVKEMVYAILSIDLHGMATPGNFNNEIGVPLTLLQLQQQHQFGVLELGASSVGEIAYTSSLVAPDIAILTNAALAHIEGFGSLDNVVQAKGELLDGLDEGGVAVLNADDLNAYKWVKRLGSRRFVSFSMESSGNADYVAEDINVSGTSAVDFRLKTPFGETDITLGHLGRHNVANALAAAAGSMEMGASLESVKEGLGGVQPAPGRLTSLVGLRGSNVIDDSYNANPDSLRAAIDVLVQRRGKRILVMGDMAELGSDSARYHSDSVNYAVERGVDEIFTVGLLSNLGLRATGAPGQAFESQEKLIHALQNRLDADTTVLVKGSRSSRMEKVVAALVERTLGGNQ